MHLSQSLFASSAHQPLYMACFWQLHYTLTNPNSKPLWTLPLLWTPPSEWLTAGCSLPISSEIGSIPWMTHTILMKKLLCAPQETNYNTTTTLKKSQNDATEMKFRALASEGDKQTAAITRSTSKRVVRLVFQSVLVSELCNQDTDPQLHIHKHKHIYTHCFTANKFSRAAPSLFLAHSLSITFTPSPHLPSQLSPISC